MKRYDVAAEPDLAIAFLRISLILFELPGYYYSYAFGSEGWIEFTELLWTLRGPGKIA